MNTSPGNVTGSVMGGNEDGAVPPERCADIGTVRWWGLSWGAPVNDPRAHISAPVCSPCARCQNSFTLHDRGVSIPHMTADPAGAAYRHWHREFFLYEIGA